MNYMYGEIPGYPEGTYFQSYKELCDAGVHRNRQAGIAGLGPDGAESIVLSGGYEDDIDEGDIVIYTGQGGQDSKKKQIKDQKLEKGNNALMANWVTGNPVRVIRGKKHKSIFSPPSGYSYGGLYRVVRGWISPGNSGFKVYRFKLIKIEFKSSEIEPQTDIEDGVAGLPRRIDTQISKLVRDVKVTLSIKELYEYRCQVCGFRIESPAKYYAEGAHIRPLGIPDNGPDVESNLLCLCPNHHVMFDFGVITINDDFSINGIEPAQYLTVKHPIDKQHLEYHRQTSIKKDVK